MPQPPVAAVRQYFEAVGAYYAGGAVEALRQLLAKDVVWHVPGNNAIAGTYRGRDATLEYFARRRNHTQRSLRIVERRVLVADDLVLHFAGGVAEFNGKTRDWETVGVYRVAEGVVAECWLVPLDQAAFDEVWQ